MGKPKAPPPSPPPPPPPPPPPSRVEDRQTSDAPVGEPAVLEKRKSGPRKRRVSTFLGLGEKKNLLGQ